ncbi:CAP domain-containing protein [Celeribacter arenosi]|uniref:SCP domain-containing protein n=1 Tax=Celeribacter arenosi TaxID=792649 RepID=A0ABP7JSD8_9RHOB
MGFMRFVVTALVMTAGLIAVPSQAGVRALPEATVQIAVSNKSQAGKDVSDLINAYRKSKGLSPLNLNAKLSKAAQKHADDMIRRGYFAHVSPSGSKPLARVRKAGYKGCLVAENLSYSWKTVDIAVAEWMKSSGHRTNIMHPRFRDVGVGIGPNNLIVAVFAKPC